MDEKKYGKIIAKNLKNIAYKRGKSQADMAKDLGISKQTVSSWMNGTRVPRMEKIDLLCRYLGISKEELLEDGHNVYHSPRHRVPVLGKVSAGIPLPAITDITDYEELPYEMLHGGTEFYALEIHGDSMEPRMRDGDRVIFRVQDDAESGDVVIAMVNGSDATCKKLRKHPHGIDLIPLNNKYEPMYFSNEQIESLPVRIIGKVVELRARF